MSAHDVTVDVSHERPQDNHMNHVWIFEPPTANGVLTQDGLTQIAIHKYKAGSYTHLDNLLNSFWQKLTDMLPLWLAPNLVTTLGGSWCLVAYLLTCYFNFDFSGETPVGDWLVVFNGVAIIVYYTFDCMDGKQARRTNSSSPLGQLFDHGVDCLGNLSHLSMVQSILHVSPHQFYWLQSSLQFAFFQAQWEEYHTGVLPHSSGDYFGVTETNYGLGVWSILTGLIFKRHMYDWILPDFMQSLPFPFRTMILGSDFATKSDLPLQVRHFVVLGWVYSMTALSSLSFLRVVKHMKEPRLIGSAVSKMFSPFLLAFTAVAFFPRDTIRFPSICFSLCICLITIKMIVFSMAKMSYACVQMLVLPLVIAAVVCRFFYQVPHLYLGMAVFYFFQFWMWTSTAIDQLCKRLGIHLFRVKGKEN